MVKKKETEREKATGLPEKFRWRKSGYVTKKVCGSKQYEGSKKTSNYVDNIN